MNYKANNREWCWLFKVSAASVLFIDNPVGTGFSYVTYSSAYAVNNEQIADDLLVLLTAFLNQLPDFKVTYNIDYEICNILQLCISVID